MGDLFFIASKLGWAVLRADSLVLVLFAAGLAALYRGRTALGTGLVSAAFLAILVVSATPLANRLLRGLESRYPIPEITGPVAGIVVLGGGEDPVSTADWGQPRVNQAGNRFLAALDLARRFPEAPVLFTGGSGRLRPAPVPEAEVARAILTGAGLEETRLILEGASRNTAENARLSRRRAPRRDGQWILVTSAHHIPRAVAAFCAAGWRGITPYPVDFRSRKGISFGWNPAESFLDLNTVLKEHIGLAVYRATGRAADPPPEGCLAAAPPLSPAPTRP